MDEMKTNPPVQNSPAEPPKKVRRVGTMAFAVLLIAGGSSCPRQTCWLC